MPSLVEIGPEVLEKKIFKSCQFIFIIFLGSLLERACSFIATNLKPLHPVLLCANWSSGSGGEDENVKSLQTVGQTDGQTDDGRHVIRKALLNFLSSGELIIKFTFID